VKNLVGIPPNVKVRVVKIEDDPEVKATLGYMGITEGTVLKILESPTPTSFIPGPFEIECNGFKGIIGQGMAETVVLEKDGKRLRLKELKAGERAKVVEIQGGEDIKDTLWNLKIEVGAELEVLRHLPDDVLLVRKGDTEIQLGEGKAAKLWVRDEGELKQLNYVEPNKPVTVARIDGGNLTRNDFAQLGIQGGDQILVERSREKSIRVANVDKAVFIEVEGHDIRLGHGIANKIWVEEK